MGKCGAGNVIGAASLLCGAPCENVIAAEEVIACAISDELWRELYVSEVSFGSGVIAALAPGAAQAAQAGAEHP